MYINCYLNHHNGLCGPYIYDTLAVVDNLQKKFEEGDILPESEIINNQAPAGPLGLDVSTSPSRKGKQRIQTAGKR